MINLSSPDLNIHPPRSCRTRLGGYVILPRMLDKCRATLTGKNGLYHYACPIDQRFLQFAGIDADQLKTEVAKGKGDGELLQWIEVNATKKPTPWEIEAWSSFRERAVPADNESREFVSSSIKTAGLDHREDLGTWFDWLDADDFVSYGGKA